MKNNQKYSMVILAIVLIYCCIYFALQYFNYIAIPRKNTILIIASLIAVFFSGTLIIAPGLVGSAESFTARFLILTTMQMLGVLSIIAYLIFTKIEYSKVTGFHLLTNFIILLFIQSYLLIIYKKRKV